MYVLIVGAGKVGWNLARELLDKGHDNPTLRAIWSHLPKQKEKEVAVPTTIDAASSRSSTGPNGPAPRPGPSAILSSLLSSIRSWSRPSLTRACRRMVPHRRIQLYARGKARTIGGILNRTVENAGRFLR